MRLRRLIGRLICLLLGHVYHPATEWRQWVNGRRRHVRFEFRCQCVRCGRWTRWTRRKHHEKFMDQPNVGWHIRSWLHKD